MRTASRDSTSRPTAARRARVSRLPRPASTRMRVFSVSRRVKFPALPEARMETRNPIGTSPGENRKRNFSNHGRGGGVRQRELVEKCGGNTSGCGNLCQDQGPDRFLKKTKSTDMSVCATFLRLKSCPPGLAQISRRGGRGLG